MPSDLEATRRWLRDIRHHIVLAQGFVEGMTCDDLVRGLRTTCAVTRFPEIMSEASRRLPEELKARHPSIAWKNMAGAGNVYRHDYKDVAVSFVWGVLEDRLPALRGVVERELAALGSP